MILIAITMGTEFPESRRSRSIDKVVFTEMKAFLWGLQLGEGNSFSCSEPIECKMIISACLEVTFFIII